MSRLIHIPSKATFEQIQVPRVLTDGAMHEKGYVQGYSENFMEGSPFGGTKESYQGNQHKKKKK